MPAFLAAAAAARASVEMGPCRRVDDMETGHLVDRAPARRTVPRRERLGDAIAVSDLIKVRFGKELSAHGRGGLGR